MCRDPKNDTTLTLLAFRRGWSAEIRSQFSPDWRSSTRSPSVPSTKESMTAKSTAATTLMWAIFPPFLSGDPSFSWYLLLVGCLSSHAMHVSHISRLVLETRTRTIFRHNSSLRYGHVDTFHHAIRRQQQRCQRRCLFNPLALYAVYQIPPVRSCSRRLELQRLHAAP